LTLEASHIQMTNGHSYVKNKVDSRLLVSWFSYEGQNM